MHAAPAVEVATNSATRSGGAQRSPSSALCSSATPPSLPSLTKSAALRPGARLTRQRRANRTRGQFERLSCQLDARGLRGKGLPACASLALACATLASASGAAAPRLNGTADPPGPHREHPSSTLATAISQLRIRIRSTFYHTPRQAAGAQVDAPHHAELSAQRGATRGGAPAQGVA